jgi:hypothetical protein
VLKRFKKEKIGTNEFVLAKVDSEIKACSKFQEREDPYVVKFY